MESKARLADISRDYQTGKIRLSFTVDRINTEELQRLQNKDLRLRAIQWREKRSLDSNAYLWLLCTKISEAMNISKEEVYGLMLEDYGTIDTLENGTPITVTMLSEIDVNLLDGHYKRYKQSKDGKFTSYIKLKGSSDMDTKEMHTLLTGVIYEAEQMGIETITPEERERMIQQWGVDLNQS